MAPVGVREGAMVEVKKSPYDKRHYRRLTLDNGMSVLLISDPEMEDAAAPDAKMDDDEEGSEGSEDEEDEDCEGEEEEEEEEEGPKIGSFSDPMEAQGLSHFLEHMLFMGSAKYPDENAYDSYLTAHGGACNAFTEAEATNFHFDVQPNALKGGLDRFAQFFVAPLMLESAVEREVNSVDSEFEQVLQNDGCRLMQVQCHTAAAGHPYRIFSWGNKKSLVDMPVAAGVNTRPLLKQFYDQHYKPQQMSLVVLGREDLDTLQEWVVEIFSEVPVCDDDAASAARVEFAAAGSPFAGGGGTLYTMPAVKEAHELHLTFALPPRFDSGYITRYKTKPDEYLSHLIGHEGKGSLLSALKEKGWATKLAAGISDGGHERATCAWLFQVTISLTEAGLERKLDVAGLFFQYVHMLRVEGPQEWVFKEVAAVKDIEFQFQEEEEPEDYVVRLSRIMHQFAPEDILCGDYMLTEWDPQLITKTLECFSPECARIDLLTSTFDPDAAKDATLDKEPWFDVPFTKELLSTELLQAWLNPSEVDPLLALPPKNEYIPHDLSVHPVPAGSSSEATGPLVCVEEVGLRVWHKQDTIFKTPRANVFIALTATSAYDSPRSSVLTNLALKLMEDALNETSYLAEVAGLNASMYPELYKIQLKLDGFSHKLTVLLDRILKQIANHQVDVDRFLPIKEEMVRGYRNRHFKPSRHCSYLRQRALRTVLLQHKDQLAVLEKVTPEEVQIFLPTLLGRLHVEVMVHGNMTEPEAQDIGSLIRHTLLQSAVPLQATELPMEAIVQLGGADDTTECVSVIERVVNPSEDNSVVESYFQLGWDTARGRAMVDMLEQVMIEPCYDVLRTKEQLGYTVSCGMRNTVGVLGYCVLVQSAAYNVPHLLARIDAFLTSFVDHIKDMSEEDWDQNMKSLISIKLQKDKCLYDESDRHWDAIWYSRYDFNYRERVVEEIRSITREELLDWYTKRIAPGGVFRRQMIAAVYGKERDMPTAGGEQGVVVDSDLSINTWRAEQRVYTNTYDKALLQKCMKV